MCMSTLYLLVLTHFHVSRVTTVHTDLAPFLIQTLLLLQVPFVVRAASALLSLDSCKLVDWL